MSVPGAETHGGFVKKLEERVKIELNYDCCSAEGVGLWTGLDGPPTDTEPRTAGLSYSTIVSLWFIGGLRVEGPDTALLLTGSVSTSFVRLTIRIGY